MDNPGFFGDGTFEAVQKDRNWVISPLNWKRNKFGNLENCCCDTGIVGLLIDGSRVVVGSFVVELVPSPTNRFNGIVLGGGGLIDDGWGLVKFQTLYGTCRVIFVAK